MEKIRVCYVSDCSEISFKMSEVFADCVLNFDDLYNGWRIVERCRLAQSSCSLNLRDFGMFYWSWFSYFCAFGALVRWLHCILTCLEIEIRTVHSCLFADDGAFILASKLGPVEECDDQSAWLRVLNEDPHSCSTHETDMFWKSGTTWRN